MTDVKATSAPFIPIVLMMASSAAEREQDADREAEMRNLLDTAGRQAVAVLAQHLPKPVGPTYIGTGKIEELKALVQSTGAKEAVFSVQLSPRQQRRLEEELGTSVIDYDELILEIFARNARTSQALLAVELAQMEYQRGRLKRLWTHLDRQKIGGSSGSGSGFKAGTGEKQIEMDRRQVRKRIQDLRGKLEEIASRTDRVVASRQEAFTVSLVGYTNAGKSTLMNALTGAGVLAENRLFATLDTRSSRLHLDGHKNVVLSDTVGFIRNLPPTLIASFHATLAEVREADLLLHVVDSASPVMEQQIAAVTKVLNTIEADNVPLLTVFNKVDACVSRTILAAVRRNHAGAVAVSAKTGEGLDTLREAIGKQIEKLQRTVEVRFDSGDGALGAKVRSRARVLKERYLRDKTVLTIAADPDIINELAGCPGITLKG